MGDSERLISLDPGVNRNSDCISWAALYLVPTCSIVCGVTQPQQEKSDDKQGRHVACVVVVLQSVCAHGRRQCG